MDIRVKLDKGAYMPTYAHDADAGLDLRTPINITVPAGLGVTINTGVHLQIPGGLYGRVTSKSGINRVYSVTCEGVVDSGYTGSICVTLINHGDVDCVFDRGDKIAQLVLERCEHAELVQADELEQTERGDGGFGSTGR